MHPVPYSAQETEDFCGPAIVQMILGAYDIRVTQTELAHELELSAEVGTSPDSLTATLRRHGFEVSAHEHLTIDEIVKALEADAHVVVCYTEPDWEWGHYAIVRAVGPDEVVLIDPDADHGADYKMPRDEFERRWRDPLFTKTERWAAFVSKPESLSKAA